MDWEKRYIEEDTPWDLGEPAPPLLEYLEGNPLEGRVLVPGCGRGEDVRAIAAHGAHVVGLDISPTAIEQAREATPADRFAIDQIDFTQGDLFALPPVWHQSFDAIFEHTCFCAIDPSERKRYASSMASVLRPNGLFLGLFYLNPESEEGPPFGVQRAELDEIFGALFVTECAWTPRSIPSRRGREEMRVLRRRL